MPTDRSEQATTIHHRSKARPVSKVWMFSLECAGLAQAGGLGEAVAGLSKTLAVDSKLDVSVFLPSHGRHNDPKVREAYGFGELTSFIAHGHRTGINGLWYNYLAGLERGSKDGVNFFLAKGLDSATSKRLDDPIIYDHENTFEKMSLFARTMGTYTDYLISMGKTGELPDVIHAHDWHMVPAAVLVKQRFQERGVNIPLVFTVHLLSGITLPWHYASEEWSGIKNAQYPLPIYGKRISTLKYNQLWEDVCHNSLERFGCYAADYVTSVSDSYLVRDVHEYVGDVIRGKSGYIYNGCDWDPRQIESTILALDSPSLKLSEIKQMTNRWDLRKFLLTTALSQAGPSEEAAGSVGGTSKSEEGNVDAFAKDGPLVLMTGRLSPQKGVDLLLDAIPLVVKVIPDARFLLFLLQSNDSDLTRTTLKKAAEYRDNTRVLLGKYPTIYLLSHLAADVYAMPSRSEPFGISALEAMVTGNPVVGTDTGGIGETVLDLSDHAESGTGLLIPREDVRRLAGSLVDLLLVMRADEETRRGRRDTAGLVQKIPTVPIRNMVRINPVLGSKIRDNCKTRVVQNFRWRNAGQLALERYSSAMELSRKTLSPTQQ